MVPVNSGEYMVLFTAVTASVHTYALINSMRYPNGQKAGDEWLATKPNTEQMHVTRGADEGEGGAHMVGVAWLSLE